MQKHFPLNLHLVCGRVNSDLLLLIDDKTCVCPVLLLLGALIKVN